MAKRESLFKDRLKNMQGEAEAAMEDYRPSGEAVPEGIYFARQDAVLKPSSSDRMMIARTFTVAEGDQTGRNVWDNLVIEDNPTGLQIARRWIERHENPETGEPYEWPEDLVDLEDIVNEIAEAGFLVKISVKRTPNRDGTDFFTNVNVNKVLEADEGEPTETEPTETEPETETTDDAGDVGEIDLDSMDRAELKALIAEYEDLSAAIRISLRMTEDDIRAKIREVWGWDDEPAEEPTEEPAEESTETTSGYDLSEILAFCASQSIEEAVEGMSEEELIEVMSGYGYNESELVKEEVEMLTALGLEGNIQKAKPAPKPKAKPKTAPKAKPKAAPKAKPKAKSAGKAKPKPKPKGRKK